MNAHNTLETSALEATKNNNLSVISNISDLFIVKIICGQSYFRLS